MLIAGPIGLWTSAMLLDWTGGGHDAARRLVGAGVLAVAPTAASGWADWSELGSAKRPRRVGLVHAAANSATAVLYGASWLARRRGEHGRGRRLALAGAAGLAVGGYLGGHLAYAEGVGVNRNADEQRRPRDWTDAAAAADVVEGTPLRVEVKGNAVLLVRSGGQVHALGATCSHWGAPLEEGTLVEDGGTCLECPWHGSRFRLADGSVARGPATSPQLAYDVRTEGDRLQVRVRP
jgi:nitrite reductase/ring-hydroxylating ferredoxin subunit